MPKIAQNKGKSVTKNVSTSKPINGGRKLQQNSSNFIAMKREIILVAFLSYLFVACYAGRSGHSSDDSVELKVANELTTKGGKLPGEFRVGNEIF